MTSTLFLPWIISDCRRLFHAISSFSKQKYTHSLSRALRSPFHMGQKRTRRRKNPSARRVQHFQKMSVREAYKPSSVIGGHLSRPIVTDGFERNPESLTGRLKRSFVSCSERGLHRGQVARPRVSSYLTFPPLHAGNRHAVSLCCTIPGVAPAGRYPAFCPMELGLSSHLTARGRPATSQTQEL